MSMKWVRNNTAENIVNNYVMSLVTYHNYSYYFEMCRNIQSLCCVIATNSIVGQLYFKKKSTEKEISNLWLQEARNGEVGIR